MCDLYVREWEHAYVQVCLRDMLCFVLLLLKANIFKKQFLFR